MDQVIGQVIAPFWHEWVERNPGERIHLWFMRYARGGEHLKLRVHSADASTNALEASLKEWADRLWLNVEPVAKEAGTASHAPVIDLEDDVLTEHPNMSLLRTDYKRSRMILGGKPLLLDDRYVALFTACLGAASGFILDAFRLDENGHLPYRNRQALFFRIVASGLSAVLPADGTWGSYLGYHSGWLIRFPLLGAENGPDRAREILARFEDEASRLGPVGLGVLRRLIEAKRREADSPFEEEWRSSLLTLASYLKELPSDPAYDTDPFSPGGPLFPTLFRIFHLAANQLGVSHLNESLSFHLLLRATGEMEEPFIFVPY